MTEAETRYCRRFKAANGFDLDLCTDDDVGRWVKGRAVYPVPARCSITVPASRRVDAEHCSDYCREELWRLEHRPNVRGAGQMELLERPLPRARRDDPETSIAAALAAAAGRPSPAATQRRRILEILRDHPDGLNFSEIDVVAGWMQYVSNRRLKELRILGLIERTEDKRLTLRGRDAFVHRIAYLGRVELKS